MSCCVATDHILGWPSGCASSPGSPFAPFPLIHGDTTICWPTFLFALIRGMICEMIHVLRCCICKETCTTSGAVGACCACCAPAGARAGQTRPLNPERCARSSTAVVTQVWQAPQRCPMLSAPLAPPILGSLSMNPCSPASGLLPPSPLALVSALSNGPAFLAASSRPRTPSMLRPSPGAPPAPRPTWPSSDASGLPPGTAPAPSAPLPPPSACSSGPAFCASDSTLARSMPWPPSPPWIARSRPATGLAPPSPPPSCAALASCCSSGPAWCA
ncbi:MAG: hypothetical protein J3K34DRAFT_193569 [Monoraphidium minutum]|nr:MAG: hypothetical protein J3K34DRAFT_193569 [Monoraphidium minutum]